MLAFLLKNLYPSSSNKKPALLTNIKFVNNPIKNLAFDLIFRHTSCSSTNVFKERQKVKYAPEMCAHQFVVTFCTHQSDS